MADGSWPFDDHGEPRSGIIWPPGTGAVFHHFHKGDDALELHNHPWDWCVSLILRGGYIEERTTREDLFVKRRTFKPGSVNVLTKYDFHRVELLDPVRGCWTLFVYGKKSQGWGFLDRHTGKFTDWRTFIYGCKRCNGTKEVPKQADFGIFISDDGANLAMKRCPDCA